MKTRTEWMVEYTTKSGRVAECYCNFADNERGKQKAIRMAQSYSRDPSIESVRLKHIRITTETIEETTIKPNPSSF